MNAILLRNILIGAIFAILASIGAVIYFASDFLSNETKKTAHAKIDAELGSQDVERLKNLEKVLEASAPSIEKADQIVSQSKQYEYQDQIVNDINKYAAKTGVNVIGFDFGATATEATPPSPTAKSSAPAISGVKTLNVTLSLASPMPYDNYLKFVKAIEQNLTKMQVSGINISPDSKNNNNIINPSVILIVYVR